MKVPADIAERIRGEVDLGFEVDADGRAVSGFRAVGRRRVSAAGVRGVEPEVGNGDTYGFY
ncbi:hypothetical protein [Longimicrobium sp.]|uniref:hypothetical protein n=1 Tax=Longimicrobium sp. TaxID=2029185 RepID=UPI002E35D86E|nr:hypothetical protein [Longimicrobium sp.]HEX6042677.1 hypothetical protein [Longimicrobium sp.]